MSIPTKAKTFKKWLSQTFDKTALHDLMTHGADTGWSGLTYTSDTVVLFDQFQDEIWELAVEQAEQSGEPVLAFINGFRRRDMAESFDSFKNLLVWFAAEHYAREMVGEV